MRVPIYELNSAHFDGYMKVTPALTFSDNQLLVNEIAVAMTRPPLNNLRLLKGLSNERSAISTMMFTSAMCNFRLFQTRLYLQPFSKDVGSTYVEDTNLEYKFVTKNNLVFIDSDGEETQPLTPLKVYALYQALQLHYIMYMTTYGRSSLRHLKLSSISYSNGRHSYISSRLTRLGMSFEVTMGIVTVTPVEYYDRPLIAIQIGQKVITIDRGIIPQLLTFLRNLTHNKYNYARTLYEEA